MYKRQVYDELTAAGYAVLLDDRKESAGVKFNDADLIGVPVRFAISNKSLAGNGVEAKLRAEKDRAIIPFDGVLDWLAALER